MPRQPAGTNDSVAAGSALLLALIAGCGNEPAAADAAISAWTTAPPVIEGAIQETGAVAIDGVIVIVGGFDAELRVTEKVRLFDTAADAWAFGPPLPIALHHANVGVIDGSVFVLGALAGQSFTATGRSFRWTPGDAAAWTELAPMPPGTERGSAVVAAHDGLLYVVGGLRGGAVSDVATYDPVTDTWNTALPPLPAPRDHACGAAMADHIVVTGGRDGAVTSVSSATYRLSPGGVWTTAAPMPTARGGAACGVTGDGLVVAGGEGNRDATSGVFAAVELYDAAADTWRSLEPMRTPRHGMGAAAWADRLYVPGGATVDGFGAVDVHEVLTVR